MMHNWDCHRGKEKRNQLAKVYNTTDLQLFINDNSRDAVTSQMVYYKSELGP